MAFYGAGFNHNLQMKKKIARATLSVSLYIIYVSIQKDVHLWTYMCAYIHVTENLNIQYMFQCFKGTNYTT